MPAGPWARRPRTCQRRTPACSVPAAARCRAYLRCCWCPRTAVWTRNAAACARRSSAQRRRADQPRERACTRRRQNASLRIAFTEGGSTGHPAGALTEAGAAPRADHACALNSFASTDATYCLDVAVPRRGPAHMRIGMRCMQARSNILHRQTANRVRIGSTPDGPGHAALPDHRASTPLCAGAPTDAALHACHGQRPHGALQGARSRGAGRRARAWMTTAAARRRTQARRTRSMRSVAWMHSTAPRGACVGVPP